MAQKIVKSLLILTVTWLALSLNTACKSNKLDCPAYSDNPAPAGIPKGNKTKSGVFPPNMKR